MAVAGHKGPAGTQGRGAKAAASGAVVKREVVPEPQGVDATSNVINATPAAAVNVGYGQPAAGQVNVCVEGASLAPVDAVLGGPGQGGGVSYGPAPIQLGTPPYGRPAMGDYNGDLNVNMGMNMGVNMGGHYSSSSPGDVYGSALHGWPSDLQGSFLPGPGAHGPHSPPLGYTNSPPAPHPGFFHSLHPSGQDTLGPQSGFPGGYFAPPPRPPSQAVYLGINDPSMYSTSPPFMQPPPPHGGYGAQPPPAPVMTQQHPQRGGAPSYVVTPPAPVPGTAQQQGRALPVPIPVPVGLDGSGGGEQEAGHLVSNAMTGHVLEQAARPAAAVAGQAMAAATERTAPAAGTRQGSGPGGGAGPHPGARGPPAAPQAASWQCAVCTYEHVSSEAQFLACAMCGSERGR